MVPRGVGIEALESKKLSYFLSALKKVCPKNELYLSIAEKFRVTPTLISDKIGGRKLSQGQKIGQCTRLVVVARTKFEVDNDVILAAVRYYG